MQSGADKPTFIQHMLINVWCFWQAVSPPQLPRPVRKAKLCCNKAITFGSADVVAIANRTELVQASVAIA